MTRSAKIEGEALVGFEFKKTLLKVMFDGFDACDVGFEGFPW